MKKIFLAAFLMVSAQAFAITEPNYGDLSDVAKSCKALSDSCPETDPRCTTLCSNCINVALGMDNGGNLTSPQKETLKEAWWTCTNGVYKN